MSKRLTCKLLLSMSVLAISVQAQAAELSGTLKKINDGGAVTVGYRESNVPFSYNGGISSPSATPRSMPMPLLPPFASSLISRT